MKKPFHYCTTDHTILHGTIHSEEGEPLIFLHYMGGNEAIWNGVIPFFIENYRVITINLRGHGYSEDRGKGYDFDTLAEDIALGLDHLGITAAHFVGSSLGAYVATSFAARWPERCLSLVNSEGALQNDTGPGGKFTESKEERMAKLGSRSETTYSSKEAYIQHLKAVWLPWSEVKERTLEGLEVDQREDGRVATKPSHNSSMQLLEHLFNVQLEDWYTNVQCPVLFLPAEVEGDLEGKLTFIKDKLEPILTISKTEVIPGTTHAMMFDHYEEMSHAILSFHKEMTSLSGELKN
ncbi:2-succinyl-6-hydroxy-2,4-cyclohexadiene-1-carboxylate synthase [Marininema mesophilum]|uniref:2-succinyl-6-hydroxy-2,4-cyclohexadiene-1-carboxylate synthase n=1 Tax=Marininema mesophilum TaxID=1048340 RepID=A0A1H3B399_9BACL|nr:alpha/beta hydrolase [Marininema mesophilum]SDX36148.1 2-succinyl-6-hydroxy-2,4-cyclohexadiene-1-carboxylate synthase [Marininema mesophilum]